MADSCQQDQVARGVQLHARAILSRSPLRQEHTLSRASIIAEIRQDIARMQKVIELLGGGKTVSIDEVVGKPRRKMSAAARKKIAAAQRARWANVRAGKK